MTAPGSVRRSVATAGLTLVTTLPLVASAAATAQAQPASPPANGRATIVDAGDAIRIDARDYTLTITKAGFRYGFTEPDGSEIAPPHAESGLRVRLPDSDTFADAADTRLVSDPRAPVAVLAVTLADGREVKVKVDPKPSYARFRVLPLTQGTASFDFRTGHVSPAYGLGDSGALPDGGGTSTARDRVELTGIDRDDITNNGGRERFISNFVIFPKQGFAEVLMTGAQKRVGLTESENRLGVTGVDRIDHLYYFVGDPHRIYADYRTVRTAAGFRDVEPRPEWFDVGWEAWGALAWNTYQTSVVDTIQDMLADGYPLAWAVVGSGFWPGPRGNPIEGTTNSFGMWDDTCDYDPGSGTAGLPCPRYPDPEALKAFFDRHDIKLILGARTNFKALPTDGGYYNEKFDGPYTVTALERGFYLEGEDGEPVVIERANFPEGSSYVLDAADKKAVAWFVDQSRRWGVDGWKEDSMLLEPDLHRDEIWNPVNEALARAGDMVMVRNTAYSVPGGIVRINDTIYGHGEAFNTDPDRMPINLLNYGASGYGNLYPDVVGGTPRTSPTDPSYRRYYVRNAIFNAVTPVLAFGHSPSALEYDPFEQAVRRAALWHHDVQPYLYDAVLDGYRTGYPYAMTPLHIAYPGDENTYHLATRENRQYEWLLGESLLATPVMGRDFDTAQTRDVYLPAGTWIDYETGAVFHGPTTLEDYPIGFSRLPLFVGGKGVLVRRAGDGLVAEVYPVRTGSAYTYTALDGRTTSTIRNANTGWDPDLLGVVDTTTGDPVDFTIDPTTGAVRFALEPGHDYRLTGGGTADHTLPVETTAPGRVDGLTHSVAEGVATLRWEPVEDARGYVVVRGGTAECAGQVVASTTGATSVALGEADRTAGSFQVMAYNARGTGPAPEAHTVQAAGVDTIHVTNEQTRACDGLGHFRSTGRWQQSSLDSFDGTETLYGSDPEATATWTAQLPSDGRYEVAVWVPPADNSAQQATYQVTHRDGTATVEVDQRAGSGWIVLGTWSFAADQPASVTVAASDRITRVDAARFTRDAPRVIATASSPGYAETGTWDTSTYPGYDAGPARFSRGNPGSTATWTIEVPETGTYRLQTWYIGSPQNDTEAAYTWTGQPEPVVVDQTRSAEQWVTLGRIEASAGESIQVTVTAGGTGITRADAIRLYSAS